MGEEITHTVDCCGSAVTRQSNGDIKKQLGIQDRWRAQSSLRDHRTVDTNEFTNSGTAQREAVRRSRESAARKESSWQMADHFVKRACRTGPVKVKVIARKAGEGESTKDEAMAVVNTPEMIEKRRHSL